MKNYKDLYGNLVLGEFPNITAKNASGPGATDGTPYERSLIDDIWGIFQDVLSSVGLTPDGIAEAAGSSQFMEAFRRGAGIPPGIILPVVMSPARLALMRMLKMEGQVVEVAAYPRLVDAIWEGTSKNATVPAFYRCNNDANKTRNAAGTHLYLPDLRGIFLRGAGANSERYASANTPYDGNVAGTYQEEGIGRHIHTFGQGVQADGQTTVTGSTRLRITGSPEENEYVGPNPVGFNIGYGTMTKPPSMSAYFVISY